MQANDKGRSARLALFLFAPFLFVLSGLIPLAALAGAPPDTMPLIWLYFVLAGLCGVLMALPRLGMGLILSLWSLVGGPPKPRPALEHSLW